MRGILISTKAKEIAKMKKYNLSAIMKRAWELVKKANLSISEGLKKAWKEAKEALKSVFTKTTPKVIEGYFRMGKANSSTYYSDQVYEAVDRGNGVVEFVRSRPVFGDKISSTTTEVVWTVAAGYSDGVLWGLNFDNIKAIFGKTYEIKDEIKSKGFKWNPAKKQWER